MNYHWQWQSENSLRIRAETAIYYKIEYQTHLDFMHFVFYVLQTTQLTIDKSECQNLKDIANISHYSAITMPIKCLQSLNFILRSLGWQTTM